MVGGEVIDSGVILFSDNANAIMHLRDELNTQLTKSNAPYFRVSMLEKDEYGHCRLHISDTCLDKLSEISAKVEPFSASCGRAGGIA